MAWNGGPHLIASLRGGTGATGSSSCSSSVAWPEAKKDKKKPAARPCKPKRTSFACLECGKTFPTQQAMAGHCSAHSRAGARRAPAPAGHSSHLRAAAPVAFVATPSNPFPQHHPNVNAVQYWCPQVQVAPNTNPMPPLAIGYVPYARPVGNQMMPRLPYLYLNGRRSSRRLATADPATNPAFRPMPNVPASGRLGWRAFLPIYGANAAPPSDAVSSTDRPGRTRAADLTLRLGTGRDHAQKGTLPLLESLMESDGHQQGAGRKRKLVISDGGDRGSNREKDRNLQIGGLDLELRLCR
ncbi:hypothetical protein ACQ4PT_018913 [Festuca glaucescens]